MEHFEDIQFIITMNGETERTQGTGCFLNGAAKFRFVFQGWETELDFTFANGVLSRKGEVSFSLPLGFVSPRTVELHTGYGAVPTAVQTQRYVARVGDNFAEFAVEYSLSDGVLEQEFSFSLSARRSLEDV